MEQSWLLVFDSIDNFIHMAWRINRTPAGKVCVLGKFMHRVQAGRIIHQLPEKKCSVCLRFLLFAKNRRPKPVFYAFAQISQSTQWSNHKHHKSVWIFHGFHGAERVSPLARPAAILCICGGGCAFGAAALDSGWCAHVN
jgi:hypothetical protein